MGYIVGIDVDGVLADLMGEVLKQLALLAEEDKLICVPTMEELTTYIAADTLDEYTAAKVREILSSPGLAATLPLIDHNAPFVIDSLEQDGVIDHIYFVTTPYVSNPTWCDDRMSWIRKNFWHQEKDIIFIHDKWMLKIDYLIDDKPENVLQAKKHGIKPIVFDRPWNRHIDISIPRAFNWGQIEDYLRHDCN